MIDVRLRRVGFGTVHDAHIPAALIAANDRLLFPFGSLSGPIIAKCGATLRGQLVVMSPDTATDCRQCRALEASQ